MIKIVARMLVKADQVETFKETARELIEKSRAEAGNVFYTLNVSASNPRQLAFIECWKDQEAIAMHNASAHFTGFFPKLSALCEEDVPPEVEIYTEVEY